MSEHDRLRLTGIACAANRYSLGRDFAADEDQPGKNHVVLLRHRLWRDRFGADPGIIGREIRMDGKPYTVIGVLRPESAIVYRRTCGLPSR